MFKRKDKNKQPTKAFETKEAILKEVHDTIKAGEPNVAKANAEVYSILASSDAPAEKTGMSDTVKVALISAGTSIVGILAVIRHENLNAIATKALGLIVKPKL